MRIRLAGLVGLVMLLLPTTLWCQTAANPVVRFRTNLGDIDVQLLPNAAPKTVANFMNYMNKGAYDNSIIHRLVPAFVLQGGGYTTSNAKPVAITTDPAIKNEYFIQNTRGTIAMAKVSGDANSATSQWFFNLLNNTNLNNDNGGFTVFGRVNDAASLAIMDKIGGVSTYSPTAIKTTTNASDSGNIFLQIPLINYSSDNTPTEDNYVRVISIRLLAAAPLPATAGIITASGFGGAATAAPGSLVEIYGSALAGTTRTWADPDFSFGNAPIVLDKVSVTVNGVPAYVNFVSPGQVNIQVPANVPTGGQVPVVVSYNGQSSASIALNIQATAPGILAPAAFKVGSTQYAAAFHADGTLVTPGTIPGVAGTPAKAGEVLVFYGVGFGPVSGAPVAGQIPPDGTSLINPVQFTIGQAPAEVSFAGLAPGLVGVYQFNVKVPAGSPTGDVPVSVSLSGVALPQSLSIAVK